jgi:hypothetical protein
MPRLPRGAHPIRTLAAAATGHRGGWCQNDFAGTWLREALGPLLGCRTGPRDKSRRPQGGAGRPVGGGFWVLGQNPVPGGLARWRC